MYVASWGSFFIYLLNMSSELIFFNFGEFSYVSSLLISSICFYWSAFLELLLIDCLISWIYLCVYLFYFYLVFFCSAHWESSLILHSIPSTDPFNLASLFKTFESLLLYYLYSFFIGPLPCFNGC